MTAHYQNYLMWKPSQDTLQRIRNWNVAAIANIGNIGITTNT